MIVAPIPWRIKIARPDAKPITAGSSLLNPVSPRGDSKAFGHQGRAKITPSDQTDGEQAIILIDIFRATVGRTGGQQLRHAIARYPAAGPGLTIGAGTVLRELGSIETQQPDTVLAQAQAVAIAGPTGA